MAETSTGSPNQGRYGVAYAEDAAPSFARRVSWSAIIAGIVLALAIQFTLGLLGMAIGLSFVDPQGGGEDGPVGWGAAIYTILSQIFSLVAGGFVAARLAGIPRDTTAFIHGALVWAGTTFAMLYLAVSSIGAVAGGAANILGSVTKGTVQTVESALPEDLPSIPTPDINLEDLPPELRSALERNQITVEDIREEAASLYNEVISEREEDQALRAARRTARDIATSPGDFPEDFEEAIDRLFGQNAPLSSEERRELINAVQEDFGLTDREAQQVVQRLETAAERAAERVQQAAEAAETEIAETADEVTDRATATFFWLFFASVLGLLAAVFGGKLGEPHHLLLRERRTLTDDDGNVSTTA